MNEENNAEEKCPVFKQCGGCTLSNKTYSEQIKYKEKKIENIFGKKTKINPSKQQFHYRTRMDFVYSENKIGLREKGRPNQVTDVKKCLLISEKANKILEKIRKETLNKYSCYDVNKFTGFLRYITIRETKQGLMLIFTTNKTEEKEEKEFEKSLKTLEKEENVKSIYWLEHTEKSDVSAQGKNKKTLGEKYLIEEIKDKKFVIEPKTFFQSNNTVAEEMFEKIKKEVKGKTLDLFCGVGVITIISEENASNITGVEIIKESIKAAKENAKINNSKAEFICENTEKHIRNKVIKEEKYDTIIVDPPRTGLKDVAREIHLLKAKKIIYMSCNPKTLRNDLETMKKYYKITSIESFDMFPQTEHVEMLVVMEKK